MRRIALLVVLTLIAPAVAGALCDVTCVRTHPQAAHQATGQKCHGQAGLGDGPDADPEHREHMDLTNPKRAEHNADGVVFYKVWNGRRKPKMPVFKEELSEDQVWSVVAYVQTLRKK